MILLASDVFGQTPEFVSLSQQLGSEPHLISPAGTFSREEEAYDTFQAAGGLPLYVCRVQEALQRYAPEVFIGFSVGATAGWVALSSDEFPSVKRALLLYGSRIRDYQELQPACPTHLLFAEHEASFDPGPLADRLRARGMDAEILPNSQHGFMNSLSPGYNRAAFNVGLAWVQQRLVCKGRI